MNILCPHCQRLLTVTEQNAGQTMNCPLCGQPFPVPVLPQTPATPYSIKSAAGVAASTEPPPTPPEALTRQPDAKADVFTLAPEPASPPPLPRKEERPTSRSMPEAPRPQPTQKVPPPPPPTDYKHTYTVWVSPPVVSLMAPLALVLVFVLMFFPWTGSAPGGRPVYTQTPFQAIGGGFWTDLVGDRVLKLSEEISKYIHVDWLAFLYLLLLVLAMAITIAPLVIRQGPINLPAVLQQMWPWRSVLSVVLCVVVLAILLAEAAGTGFGLEIALAKEVDERLKDQRPSQPTEEETAKWNVQRGAKLGELNLHRTSWFRLAELFHLLAIAGVSLELWLERRGARPLPRVDFRW